MLQVLLAYGWQSGVSSLTNFKLSTVSPQSTEPKAVKLTPLSVLEKVDFSRAYEMSSRVIATTETSSSHKGMQAMSQDAVCMLEHSSKLDIYSAPVSVPLNQLQSPPTPRQARRTRCACGPLGAHHPCARIPLTHGPLVRKAAPPHPTEAVPSRPTSPRAVLRRLAAVGQVSSARSVQRPRRPRC